MLRKKIHNVQFLKPKNLKKCMKLNWNFQSGQAVGNVHGYFQELNNPFSLSGMKFGMGNVQVSISLNEKHYYLNSASNKRRMGSIVNKVREIHVQLDLADLNSVI